MACKRILEARRYSLKDLHVDFFLILFNILRKFEQRRITLDNDFCQTCDLTNKLSRYHSLLMLLVLPISLQTSCFLKLFTEIKFHVLFPLSFSRRTNSTKPYTSGSLNEEVCMSWKAGNLLIVTRFSK